MTLVGVSFPGHMDTWPSPFIRSHVPFVFWVPCGFIREPLLSFPGLSEFRKHGLLGSLVGSFSPWWTVCLKGSEISCNFLGLCRVGFSVPVTYLLGRLYQRWGALLMSFNFVSFHLSLRPSIWKSKHLRITLIRKWESDFRFVPCQRST